MNHRFVAGFLFSLSIFLIGLGYFLLHPNLIGLCTTSDNCLSEFLRYGIAKPLYWSIYLLPFLFFGLIFVSKNIFNSWLKLGIPLGVLFLIVIFLAPPLPGFYTPDRTLVTERLTQIFVAISVFFIAWKYWRLSKQKPKT